MMLERAPTFATTAAWARDYEAAGVDLVAVPEAYTFDAVSQLGYLAAATSRVTLAASILPIYSRTPALIAMTSAGLDAVSGGRFLLGLGASGPQVIEGFHGVAHDAPVARTREIIEICRRVWRREPLTYNGRHYQVPLNTAGRTARPLKLVDHPVREAIPIAVAALGPKSVALAAELAEGWQPIFFHPGKADVVWGEALRAGQLRRDAARGPLDVMVQLLLGTGGSEGAALDAGRAQLAMYLGGMGSREQNFYNRLAHSYGYAEAAEKIQDLFLSGRRDEAAEAVPEELIRAVNLIGTPDDLRHQLDRLRAAGVGTLIVRPQGAEHSERVEQIAVLRNLVG